MMVQNSQNLRWWLLLIILDLLNRLQTFHEVERVKGAPAITKAPAPPVLEAAFKEEFFGPKKVSSANTQTIANSDHGLIVNTLAKQLKSKGISIGNTHYVGLDRQSNGLV